MSIFSNTQRATPVEAVLEEKYYGPAAWQKRKAKIKSYADHLAKLEDHNDFSGYVHYLAAKVLRDKEAAKAAKAIVDLHNYLGHMPAGLSEVRQSLSKKVVAELAKSWQWEEMKYFKELTGL